MKKKYNNFLTQWSLCIQIIEQKLLIFTLIPNRNWFADWLQIFNVLSLWLQLQYLFQFFQLTSLLCNKATFCPYRNKLIRSKKKKKTHNNCPSTERKKRKSINIFHFHQSGGFFRHVTRWFPTAENLNHPRSPGKPAAAVLFIYSIHEKPP